MANLLENLEPKPLWHYFLELSKIPRGSKNEREAAKWCAEQGRALGLDVKQDTFGNVLISKPGTSGKEHRPGVCLQAHVDMVCEMNEGTRHDFLKDPIDVYRDGDLLKARGTTLGADNGIGVAMGLALMAAKDIPHGPVELLITLEEETGLDGAINLPSKWMKSKYLINLDSESEGELTIGCAGGVNTLGKRRITLSEPKSGMPYRIKVSGLRGGHSGLDINKGRGNAIRVLGQVLQNLQKNFHFELSSIQGGNKHNAIPREASATVFLNPVDESRLRTAIASQEALWKTTFGHFDPDLTLQMDKGEGRTVMSETDTKAILGMILSIPLGVESMSSAVPGLVQTSTNLGVLETKGDSVETIFCTRSAIESSRQTLSERIGAALSLAGFSWDLASGYPGWQPNPESSLVQTVTQAYQQIFGKPMKIAAIHAGLECGIIGEKQPGMEMVSIGPNQKNVHTPDEQVSISSTANVWKLIQGVLERL